MRGCKTIIAVDRTPSRLSLARSVGATHTIDTSTPDVDLVVEVFKVTGGRGVHVALDTTGTPSLAKSCWHLVRNGGKVLQVGLAHDDATWDVPMARHMNSGKSIIGCQQGGCIPQRDAIKLARYYREGKLPIGGLSHTFPSQNTNRL